MFQQEGRKAAGLTGAMLKMTAIAAMLTDHCAVALVYPAASEDPRWFAPYLVMRAVGRLAFPIYCFLLAEGFFHTGNRKRYFLRLLLFAAVSEVPFDLLLFGRVFAPEGQNVFFTLAIGIAVMWGMERYGQNSLRIAAIAAAGGCGARLLGSDYGFFGVVLAALLWLFRNDREKRRIGAAAAGFAIYPNVMCIPYLCFIPLMERYNGRRGMKLGLWAYWFYPVHLLILKGLQLLLF